MGKRHDQNTKCLSKKKEKKSDLQKEASKEVKRGQLIDALDSTPHPFNSSNTIRGASIWSAFSLGHIPKLRDRRPTCKKKKKKTKQALSDLPVEPNQMTKNI